MRKRKPPTKSLSCRVPQEMAEAVLAHGEELDMIQTEIVQHLLCVAFYGDEAIKNLEQRVLDAEARLKDLKAENEQLKKDSPWQVEPLKSDLAQVLQNEEVLNSFYQKYKREAFNSEEIIKAGLKVGFLLSPRLIGGSTYWFMVYHGWCYTDNTGAKMRIRKDS